MKVKIVISALCLLCVCAAHHPAAAHVLDQYLQVTQIALAPNNVRIELRLIPGIQVAKKICALIDTDGDGQITKAEEQAYTQRVSQDIELAICNVKAPLTLINSQFPPQQEMREGVGTIRLTYEASATLGAADYPQVYFRNNHLPELGVYLVNALIPATNAIKLGGQERDPLQREMRLSFHVTPAITSGSRSWAGVLMFFLCLALLFSQWKHLRQFLRRYHEEKIHARKTFS